MSTLRQLLQRAHHQPGAGEQHERERGLDDHQPAPQPMRARGEPADRPRTSACWPSTLDAWNAGNAPKTMPQTAAAASANSSAAPSRLHVGDPRRALGRDRDQRAQQPARRPTPSTPPTAEMSVLSTSICASSRSASAAERGADGELVLPRRAARDQQVGDVDARDEQQEADRAEQREQREPDVGDERDRRAARRGRRRPLLVFGYSRSSEAAIVFSSRSRGLDA